jgi:ribosome-binding protein aMBF1 (putative translation factor)
MDINPAYKAYTNLGIAEATVETTSNKGMGLLSPMRNNRPKEKSDEPRDRVRQYVARIRKAREQLKDG